MDFTILMKKMTQAVVQGDGQGVADCFSANGTYHDVFYGSFKGGAIVDLIENHFHRDGSDFLWDLHDAVEQGGIGYVRYVFSYSSKIPESKGRRAVFEGVAICRVENSHILEYREVANAVVGLHLLGFEPQRLSRFIDRETKALLARPEARLHRSN